MEGSDLLTVDANIRALEKMAEGVKTGFTILSLLMGKLYSEYITVQQRDKLKVCAHHICFLGDQFFKSPMLQGAVESNLFYDVTPGHL